MARHKDIDRAHADFEGHGFHIEYHREAVVTSSSRKPQKKHIATKRDKRRCIHYNKNNKNCYKLKCACMGSSDCASYRDWLFKVLKKECNPLNT